jgi:enterochelin esterase-like enzyme
MAGTSMGGMQTQRTVFKYPNIFAWAGILSGGLTIKNNETDYSTVLLDKDKFKDTFRMLFVACGKQDGLYKFTMDSVNEVLQHEVSPELYFTDGYHDWTFWRHSIAEFLKKLFR